MVKVKPFRGLRPKADLVERVASPPYDVLSSDEARQMAAGNELSFLNVTKPEITFAANAPTSGSQLYDRARDNLKALIERGAMAHDPSECVYVYRLNWRDVDQTGYMILSSCADYINGSVKRHEFTRPDKEADRTALNDITNAQTGPVFLFYHSEPLLDEVLDQTKKQQSVYDFVAADVRHRFWVISDHSKIAEVVKRFAGIDNTYIADGHHRCAAAANVFKQRSSEHAHHTGEEPCAFFLSVIFPEHELKILPYNRVVTDLNGNEPSQFLNLARNRFEVTALPAGKTVEPEVDKVIGMYLDGKWYKLAPQQNSYNKFDPIESLDVSILQKNLLEPVLGISKPRTDKRIDFVGGIRGTGELIRLVDSGKFKVAFVIPPVSLRALRAVADSGGVMPPKSTWFEPKLRDGIAVYTLFS